MRRRCHIDIETYSECNLKDSGVYVYAEHPSTEILVVCFRFDDGPVQVWIPANGVPIALFTKLELRLTAKFGAGKYLIIVRDLCPIQLQNHIKDGGEVAAHNAQFERTVINGSPGRKLYIPKIKIEQCVCTAAKARTFGLPGALGDAAKALGTYPKDETGRSIMLKLCRPRTGKQKRYPLEGYEDDYVHLYTYCADDVFAECGLDEAIPDISPEECDVWRLDQRINDRGVGVDLDRIADVQYLIAEYKKELEAECIRLTGWRPTQREKIATWVRGQGYHIFDMQADTVNRAVVDGNCPDHVKRVLAIYSTYGMKAVAKFDAIEAAVASDSRIHGMMLYYGAGTGRWSSLIVQLQNLYRPKIKDAETAIDAYRLRCLETIEFLYPHLDPMKVFASTVRGMLVPADGCDLIVLDYAGIESRKIAWLYDEFWKIDAFRARDADPKNNPDNYQLAYGRGFSVDPLTVKDFERQIGKVMELALGYEGGVGAFVTMAPTYNVDLAVLADRARDGLPEWALDSANWMWKNFERKRGNPSGLSERVYTTIDGIKQVWRGLHPAIKQGWKDSANAAKLAVANPGKVFAIPNKKLMFKVDGRWLKMRLPSGRVLSYLDPELHDNRSQREIDERAAEKQALEAAGIVVEWEDELSKKYVTYMGVDSTTKQWRREATYGGKIAENAVQASSNCLLRKAMLRLDRAGYHQILSVHDECVAEVAEKWGSLEEMSRLMCQSEPWCADLPLVAEGYRAKRYRKG